MTFNTRYLNVFCINLNLQIKFEKLIMVKLSHFLFRSYATHANYWWKNLWYFAYPL